MYELQTRAIEAIHEALMTQTSPFSPRELTEALEAIAVGNCQSHVIRAMERMKE